MSECGLFRYKQGLDCLWCINWILCRIHVFFDCSYSLRTCYGYI